MKKIAVLGSTGSIGTQTLEVVRTNKDIEITALAAGRNLTPHCMDSFHSSATFCQYYKQQCCLWEIPFWNK